MTSSRLGNDGTITAAELTVGTVVKDNFTAWAEVLNVHRIGEKYLNRCIGVRVQWQLADGTVCTDLYEPENEFIITNKEEV